jgi:hypothetical protein
VLRRFIPDYRFQGINVHASMRRGEKDQELNGQASSIAEIGISQCQQQDGIHGR